ncbi:short-chain dehydrogenase/reductase SDR [Panaeolus papilionaceus]|nr:short-chain dehydrogenase/reductase SDR [Panaeolus papilionaceus]
MSKVAIVTGASSGIGRATAIALSEAAWTVVLTARRETELQETSKSCPSPTLIVAGDITNETFVKKLFNETVSTFGHLDLLFNNAGVSAKGIAIEDMSLETFTNVLNVNVVGPFLATREAVRIFKSQNPQGGRIINNGSLAAHVPRPNGVPYTVSKHAITGLTKCTALDGRNFNITCTQIDIGNALTDMAGGQAVGILQPSGQIASEATFDPKHVGSTVVHIANLPPDVAMLEVNIMAAKMPYVGRG